MSSPFGHAVHDTLVLFQLANVFRFWMPLSKNVHFLLATFDCSAELSAVHSQKCESYVGSGTVTPQAW